jgi:hypothetical protein
MSGKEKGGKENNSACIEKSEPEEKSQRKKTTCICLSRAQKEKERKRIDVVRLVLVM